MLWISRGTKAVQRTPSSRKKQNCLLMAKTQKPLLKAKRKTYAYTVAYCHPPAGIPVWSKAGSAGSEPDMQLAGLQRTARCPAQQLRERSPRQAATARHSCPARAERWAQFELPTLRTNQVGACIRRGRVLVVSAAADSSASAVDYQVLARAEIPSHLPRRATPRTLQVWVPGGSYWLTPAGGCRTDFLKQIYRWAEQDIANKAVVTYGAPMEVTTIDEVDEAGEEISVGFTITVLKYVDNGCVPIYHSSRNFLCTTYPGKAQLFHAKRRRLLPYRAALDHAKASGRNFVAGCIRAS